MVNAINDCEAQNLVIENEHTTYDNLKDARITLQEAVPQNPTAIAAAFAAEEDQWDVVMAAVDVRKELGLTAMAVAQTEFFIATV